LRPGVIRTPVRNSDHWFTKPEHKTSNSGATKELIENAESDLASYLAQIVQECPDLVSLIEAWPKLSLELRRAIAKMVQ